MVFFPAMLMLLLVPERCYFILISWLFHCYCVKIKDGLSSEQESSRACRIVRRLSFNLVLDLDTVFVGEISSVLIFLPISELFYIEIVN